MKDSSGGLGTKMALGAGWMLLARLGVRGIGLLSTMILARLLVPEDFGLIAVAMIIVAGLDAISDLSFNAYLISHQDIDRRHYDSIWTLSILRGVLIGGVLWLGAPYFAEFFGESRLTPILQWIAAGSVLQGFENVGIVDFQKNFTFRRDFTLMIWTKAASFVVTVAMAFTFENYWALVAGIVTGRAAGLILSFTMHPFRPRLSVAAVGDVLGFSSWMLANSVALYLRNKSDHLMLAKLLGAGSLGIYTVAFDISQLVGSEILAPLTRAFLPGYSKIADDRSAISRMYLDSLTLVAFLFTPLTIGMGLTAEPLVWVLLGSKWLETIPLIEVFSIYAFMTVLAANSTAILLALHRPATLAWITIGTSAALIPILLVVATVWGSFGAALTMVGLVTVHLLLRVSILLRLLDLSLASLVLRTWRVLAGLLTMAAVVLLVAGALPPVTSFATALFVLLAQVAAGGIAYGCAVALFWLLAGRPAGPETQIVGFCWQMYRQAVKNSHAGRQEP